MDGKLAPALAKGLRLFAKPWYKRRALRIFRDEENLSAQPSLWSSVQEGLDSSEFFILLASPEAARSVWVNREVDHWLGRRPAENLLVVVTGGDIEWNPERGEFDRVVTTCLPPALYDVFRDEPRWVDLRAAHQEQDVSLRVPSFRDRVADLAARLHRVAKDDILGEDLAQHRRTRQLVITGIALLAVVAFVAAGAAVLAVNRGRLADEQRQRAEDGQRSAIAGKLVAQAAESLPNDPRTALRLAIAAHHIHPDRKSQADLYQTLTATAFAGKLPDTWHYSTQTIFPTGDAMITSADHQLVIWDIRSTPPAKMTTVNDAGAPVLSPDGLTLATLDVVLPSSGKTQFWRLWDLHDRLHPAQVGPAHPVERGGVMNTPVLSPDQRLLAMAGVVDNFWGVFLWDISDRAQPRLVSKFAAEVDSVAFAPDGHTLVIGSGQRVYDQANMVVELWDVTAPDHPTRLVRKTFTSGGYVRSLAYSRDGSLLVASGSGPQGDTHVATVLIDVTNKRRPSEVGRVVPGQLVAQVTGALSPTAPILATSGGPGRAVLLWDITDRAEPKHIDTVAGHRFDVAGMTFTPDGDTLITWETDDNGVSLWRHSGRTDLPPSGRVTPSAGPAISTDGKMLVSANGKSGIDVWDVNNPGRPHQLTTTTGKTEQQLDARAVALSSDSLVVAIGGTVSPSPGHYEGAVFLWSISDRTHPQLIAELPLPYLGIRALAFEPGSRMLAVGGHDALYSAGNGGMLDLWDLEDDGRPAHLGKFTLDIPGTIHAIDFSPDGRLLVAGGGEDYAAHGASAVLFDVGALRPTGQMLTGAGGTVSTIAFASDGHTLAIGGGGNPIGDGAITLWDITDQDHPARIGQPLVGHRGQITEATFTPDGRTLVTAGGDDIGTILLWDVTDLPNTHQIGHPFPAHRGLVTALAATNNTVASTGYDLANGPSTTAGTTTMLWDLGASADLRDHATQRACDIADGGLDHEEWSRYVPSLSYQQTCP